MKLLPRIFSALVFVFLASSQTRGAETVEIKQRWLAGKKYYQTIETEQQSTFAFGPQKVEQKTTMTMNLTVTVNAPHAGEPKHITIRYERMAMDMDMNGQKMAYDSSNPGANTDPLGLGKSLGAIMGQELKATLNEKDEIASIDNYDDFIKHFGPSPVPGMDPAKMFSRESLTQMMKQSGLAAAPEKPVGVGDSWPFHNQFELQQMGKITVSGTYTLKSIGDHKGARCAEIMADGKLAMTLGGAAIGGGQAEALGMKVTDGSMSGPVWFDLQLGITRESQLTQDMTISMKNPTDPTGTVDIPMKQHVTVNLTKVEDVKE